jgi:death-on-curing protein
MPALKSRNAIPKIWLGPGRVPIARNVGWGTTRFFRWGVGDRYPGSADSFHAFIQNLTVLLKQGRMPKCSKNDLEDLMVEIADMEIVNRARYKKLTEAEEDPEVKYISQWLRRNTRKMDDREYRITYRDLRRILGRYGFVLENPHSNMIDIIKVEKRSGLAFFGGPERRQRVGRIGYPGDTRQVSLGDIRRVRRMCGLTSTQGIDSQAFYHGVDDMTSLLAEYQDNLRRLADR